jgi:hypothetical protein
MTNSNETKRDVFEELLDAYDDAKSSDGNLHPKQELLDYDDRYDAALPDDLPVIPKAVSEWIKECKHNNTTLANALCMEMRPEAVRWWMEFKDGDIANRFDYAGYPRKQEIMAKAWVLGVWRIEETGEIVKLEAQE